MRVQLASLLALCAVATPAERALAIDIPGVGGETLTLDISNTTDFGYRFNNRNDTPVGGATQTLVPSQHVDDSYGEWFNRLYARANYWKLSFGVRLDSAVYFETLSRADAQRLIVDELGAPDLDLENRFGRELHSRYTSLIYPAKLWLSYTSPGVEVTLGDFYAHLGRGLVFSVRKLDEVGIDTTVRGVKAQFNHDVGDLKLGGMVFGGQLNPIRLDFPTGRVLHGTDSPLFFGFPRAGDFKHFGRDDEVEPRVDAARPSYLEDTAIGGRFDYGIKPIQFSINTATLLRSTEDEDLAFCRDIEGRSVDQCLAAFPTFATSQRARRHDRIHNVSLSMRIPPIENTVDAYFEVARQFMREGRVNAVDSLGEVVDRESDLDGLALYGNVNVNVGPVSATLEAKHYRRFFRLGANIDTATVGFGAPEFAVVAFSQPPTTESIYVQQIDSPDNCISGGRARLDARLTDTLRVYSWVGRYASWTEIDSAVNDRCDTVDALRTDTWDISAGTEIEAEKGKTHAWAWIGTRINEAATPRVFNSEIPVTTGAFFREEYVRYDLHKHLTGPFSLSALGFHRRRYQPIAAALPWHDGENLLSLNWAPHLSFIFGYEYQTLPGFPTHYFNGSIQYRSKDNNTWYGRMLDAVRVFVGQRRAALRCVAGVCRVFPAYEGGRIEVVSRF